MSWKIDANKYILSENISAPIIINVVPDIFVETFWKFWNIEFFTFILFVKKARVRNGIPMPIEKNNKYTIPKFTVSAFDDRVKSAPNTGPMQGVNPKPKVNPIIKFFNFVYLSTLIMFEL